RALSHAATGTLKDLPVSGPIGRTLHGAVAAGLLLALRLALKETATPDGPWGPACEVTASPLPWIGGVRMLWGSGLTCYGVPVIEPPARFNEHAQKIAQGGTLEVTVREVAGDLFGSKEAMRKAARQVALARLRADLLTVLRLAELSRAPAFSVEAGREVALGQAEGQLVHRQGGETEGGIATEHEAGKRYLLGLEERPLLKARSRAAHMGHLFCDMKDFTKRTAFLKETVVA